MMDVNVLLKNMQERFGAILQSAVIKEAELTVEVAKESLLEVCTILKEESAFQFEMLIDVAGVDYLHYGLTEWQTLDATAKGFERGVKSVNQQDTVWNKPRFAVVYHLLSIALNARLRIKVFLEEHNLQCPSVVPIWNSANWFEREAFDLFGILFENHPDLRRILTDYGFIGHPFRKDFALSGNVEMRYDAVEKRVVYEPVSIKPRVLVPKTIRHDNRYTQDKLNG